MPRIDTDHLKQQYDLRTLAAHYTTLKKATVKELAGPCPRCGGHDRFHVQAAWFFCRHCHEQRGDVIAFIQWLEGCTFAEACAQLANNSYALPQTKQQPTQPQRPPRDYRPLAVDALRRLASAAGLPGCAYLTGRGITEATWSTWGLGLLDCRRRGAAREYTKLGQGIAMPWVVAGQVTGINCRLLDHPQRYHRVGNISGLFGEHKLVGHETLVLCEGEINALSIWQALAGGVDVLSFGSESVIRTARFVEVARRYRHVLIWCDREPVVQAALLRYPEAVGIKSPRGLDANDLLRAGLLAKFLAEFLAVPAPACPSPASPQERRFAELLGRAYLLADEARELRNLARVLGREVEVKRVALV